MSVRRLADAAVQPDAFAFSADNENWAEATIAKYPQGRQQSAVIPLLMRAQDQEGWLSKPAIEHIADRLAMPYIRALEVATFYTQFQLQPVGTLAHIQLCGTTPCMLRGAEELREVCQRRIHEEPHHLNATGTLSWEEVECLGACVNAPMVAIGPDTYEDLTPERLGEIIEAFGEGRGDEIPPGPQNGRRFAMAATGATTLLDDPERDHGEAEAAPTVESEAPTTPGRKREVSEEAAPAMRGTPDEAKLSTAKAEAERKQADRSAGADGTPASAMREGATGAESPAGKIDAGDAVGKPEGGPGIQHGERPEQVAEAGSKPKRQRRAAAPAADEGVSPSRDGGASATENAAPDDLKLISGIGPGLEGKLNGLGITTYAQVAVLTPDDIARIEETLSFRGRIGRDDWLAQAEALAAGGPDEYRKRFGKDPR